MIEELIEKLHKGELSKDDYPCLNDLSQTFHGTSQTAAVNPASVANPAQSKQTRKWALPQNSNDGYSRRWANGFFVFIIGGATRSELRVCHKLTTKLKREVVLCSSRIDDPP